MNNFILTTFSVLLWMVLLHSTHADPEPNPMPVPNPSADPANLSRNGQNNGPNHSQGICEGINNCGRGRENPFLNVMS
ncbi:hypothetical protein CHUAL_012950 [Chamberlinius hualienensis]